MGVIAAARALRRFQHVVEVACPDWQRLAGVCRNQLQTDALPIGAVREMWHPSTAELEDQKVAEAEEMYRQCATQAAQHILSLLRSPAANCPKG